MRRRMTIALLGVIALAAALLAQPRETRALETWIEKGKTDCKSVELGITLTYSRDDTGATGNEDFFRLEIYDATSGQLLAQISESILQEQSPFYWQTGSIPAAALAGYQEKALYRIEMLDTDDKGGNIRLIDQVFLQCDTQNTWRKDPVPLQTPVGGIPDIQCYSRVPMYSTNGAPEKGVVIVQWTYGTSRTDVEYHLQTIPVERGSLFNHEEIQAPCSTYLRMYFQPDSTKLLYYMPSQYWPHNLYGTVAGNAALGPVYHTFFPLDGPSREAIAAGLPPGGSGTPSPGTPISLAPTPTSTWVGFNAVAYSTSEANDGQITLILSQALPGAVTVAFTTSNGTAAEAADFTDQNAATVTFNPGETIKTVTVVINKDAMDEDDETVKLTLSAANGAVLGQAEALLTINDDDPAPKATWKVETIDFKEEDGKENVDLILSNPSESKVKVTIAVTGGSATQNVDYTMLDPLTIEFEDGTTVMSYRLRIEEDVAIEGNETIVLTITDVTNGTIGDAKKITITIKDNDD